MSGLSLKIWDHQLTPLMMNLSRSLPMMVRRFISRVIVHRALEVSTYLDVPICMNQRHGHNLIISESPLIVQVMIKAFS